MKNRPQRSNFEGFMIRDYDTSVRRLTPEDYVTSLLPLHSEADFR
jgi:hypothetical protein